jgi:hypothetical protein
MQIGSGFANALNLLCHAHHSNRFRFCKYSEFVDMNKKKEHDEEQSAVEDTTHENSPEQSVFVKTAIKT